MVLTKRSAASGDENEKIKEGIHSRRAHARTIQKLHLKIQMVDRPNTTPVGQDKKTLTVFNFQSFALTSMFSKDFPFQYESRRGFLSISLRGG